MTVHLAKQATLQPLELTTWCGKKGRDLPTGDMIAFGSDLPDCDGCELGRRTPVCAGKRHVVASADAARCQCGERKIDRAEDDKPKPPELTAGPQA